MHMLALMHMSKKQFLEYLQTFLMCNAVANLCPICDENISLEIMFGIVKPGQDFIFIREFPELKS